MLPRTLTLTLALGLALTAPAVAQFKPLPNDPPINVRISPDSIFWALQFQQDGQLKTGSLFVPMDPFGRLGVRAHLTDGKSEAVLRGSEGAQPADKGLVTKEGIAPNLQCPYSAPINQTTNTVMVVGKAGQRVYFCTFLVISADAKLISLVEGTGSVCASNTLGIEGGASASASVLAGSGWVELSDRIQGFSMVAGNDVCLFQSTAGNVSGRFTYVLY